jgi:hypothetical protein
MDSLQIETQIRAWADARALPAVLAERWLALDHPSRIRLLELARDLKFRTGQFMTAFELLEEIAVRETETIDAILRRPLLRRPLRAAGSGPGRARALIDELRGLRYPRLKRACERLSAELAALGMPRGIKVVLPRELASDEVRIEIVAHGSLELSELLETLRVKAGHLVRIATMLGGTDTGVTLE